MARASPWGGVWRKPECKLASWRTETSYKAESLGKAAQHVDAQGTGDTVNGAATQGRFTFLSGEICIPCSMKSFPVKLPVGFRFQNIPAQSGSVPPFCEIRNKEGRQEVREYGVMRSNSYGENTEVSRRHSSQTPGVMPRTRWRAEHQGEERYPWVSEHTLSPTGGVLFRRGLETPASSFHSPVTTRRPWWSAPCGSACGVLWGPPPRLPNSTFCCNFIMGGE